MPRTRIILDVDTGTDDALAIAYAVAHPELDLAAVTCVAGNTSLSQVVINTHKVLDAAGAPDVPVAAGAAKPLLEPTRAATHFHGLDGLGDLALPASARTPSPHGAIELLRRTIMESPEPVTLVGLAPQTNLALLISQHPEVIDNLARIVFMGGAVGMGNATAVAEFNVWHDPEAAAMVINSGLPITMYGLDVYFRLRIAEQLSTTWTTSPHPAIRMAGALLHRRRPLADGTQEHYTGMIGDAGALIMITNPNLFTTKTLPTQINLTGLGRGQTIVDQRTVAGEDLAHALQPQWPLVTVALDLDEQATADKFATVIEQLKT